MPPVDDGERAARVALSQLDGVGPARLRWLMGDRSAEATFTGLCLGTLPIDDGAAPRGVNARLVERWRSAARSIDPARVLERHRELGLGVLVPGDPHWPFRDDPEPPSVLYVWGDASLLRRRPAVAIVGTRRCTDLGRSIARAFGNELAMAGVDVISGLALGIDGAAHAGTLDAAAPSGGHDARSSRSGEPAATGVPIAVVANGLDRVSPRFHRRLSEQVAARGAVVSEAPLGTNGDRWRFPARNRLIAGLSDVVIVVESHAKGGALITVDEAIDRGVPVMAVPGSIRSEASVGTNRLLSDGAVPACGVADVLTLLGLDHASFGQGRLFAADEAATAVEKISSSPLISRLVAELSVGPLSIDRLVQVSGHPIGEVMVAVQRMATLGHIVQVGSTVSLSSEAGPVRR